MQNNTSYDPVGWHGTTILCVRRDGRVAMAGDGQVTLGQTVIKGNARKVRRIGRRATRCWPGLPGATADAFTLLERLEAKLERFPQPARTRLRRTGEGLAHRPLPPPAGGDDGGGRLPAIPTPSPATATCWSRMMG